MSNIRKRPVPSINEQNVTERVTMTSREIAEVANKPHSDVLKAIRKMEVAWIKVSGGNFSLAEYEDEQGKIRPMYVLTKTECLYIATKFNDEARAKLIIRWEELEAQMFAVAEPLGGVLPILYNGVAGYPRKEIFEVAGYSSGSGMVSTLKRRYPEHFFSIFRTACVSKEFAKLRLEQGRIRQMELDFHTRALSHGTL